MNSLGFLCFQNNFPGTPGPRLLCNCRKNSPLKGTVGYVDYTLIRIQKNLQRRYTSPEKSLSVKKKNEIPSD